MKITEILFEMPVIKQIHQYKWCYKSKENFIDKNKIKIILTEK